MTTRKIKESIPIFKSQQINTIPAQPIIESNIFFKKIFDFIIGVMYSLADHPFKIIIINSATTVLIAVPLYDQKGIIIKFNPILTIPVITVFRKEFDYRLVGINIH